AEEGREQDQGGHRIHTRMASTRRTRRMRQRQAAKHTNGKIWTARGRRMTGVGDAPDRTRKARPLSMSAIASTSTISVDTNARAVAAGPLSRSANTAKATFSRRISASSTPKKLVHTKLIAASSKVHS